MKAILVCVDFSEFTDKVIAKGIELAKAFKSELCLLHVTRPHLSTGDFDTTTASVRHDVAEHFAEEHEKLQALSSKARDQGVQARALLVEGAPAAEFILKEAVKMKADLIIAGSLGHSRLGGLLVGSVTQSLVQKINVPVMIIPK
jgi:nucleotide-binding universal stress UspA family protein